MRKRAIACQKMTGFEGAAGDNQNAVSSAVKIPGGPPKGIFGHPSFNNKNFGFNRMHR